MNTDYLKYFWEVYETKSINKAAENLYLSQPYLSKCIKEVERQIGAQLIIRSHRGVAFTETGEKFICHVKTILEALDAIDTLTQQPSVTPQTILVSCFNSFTLINIIHQYNLKKKHNDFQINYLELQNQQIIEHVQNRASDFGFFYYVSTNALDTMAQIQNAGLAFFPILTDALYAVVGKNHPLFSESQVVKEQLKPFPLMLQKIKSDLATQDRKTHGIYQFFKEFQIDLVALENNAGMLFQISKDDHHFTIGQKAFNVDNPLFQHGEIKYLPILNTEFQMITGLLVKETRAKDPIFLDFLNALKTIFTSNLQKT